MEVGGTMSMNKRAYVQSLVDRVPIGEEFTTRLIVDMARGQSRYCVSSSSVGGIISKLDRVKVIGYKKGRFVYVRED